jgi:predicted acetyltransferase
MIKEEQLKSTAQLVEPSVRYNKSWLELMTEPESYTAFAAKFLKEPDLTAYLQIIQQEKEGNLRTDSVPRTILWLVDGEDIIGRASIKHTLPDSLRLRGHIGYYIRPKYRKKGYGYAICEMTVKEAKKLGITKIVISALEHNIGSRKIIEKNGGVFEGISTSDDGSKLAMYTIS